MLKAKCLVILLPALAACAGPLDTLSDFEPVNATTVLSAPEASPSATYDVKQVDHGKYLVELLGCGACHTHGALIGWPDEERLLAGSGIGLAHSNPLQVEHPAIVFAPNLTPDVATGIGGLSDEAMKQAIRHGVGRRGVDLKVMPVAALARLRDEDLADIVAYLRSLEPVRHEVPDAVQEGETTDALFVHFGVYQNRLEE